MNKNEAIAMSFYAALKDATTAARRVGWESNELHELRLRTLIDAVGPLDSVGTILDAGCGEGRLLPLLRNAGFAGAYRGEDILPHMVERAKQRHPSDSFVVADCLDHEGVHADIILCSGTLNTLDDEDTTGAFANALGSLWNRTNISLAIDFAVLDRHSDGAHIARYAIESTLSAARSLTRWVRLIEGTIPGEAILVLSRSSEAELQRIGGTEHLALSIADLHLRSQVPEAARRALLGRSGTKPGIFRALADAQSGRLRDAETSLRSLAETSSEASLHLALLLIATRRQAEGITRLERLRADNDEQGDAARYQLMLQTGEDNNERRLLLYSEMTDPWIRREAETLLHSRH